jgi:hypothetical protein
MATFKVVWEIQIEANNALHAAKIAQDWQRDIRGEANQFYVQQEDKKEVVSVDLDEEDCDAVLPVSVYHALIQQ